MYQITKLILADSINYEFSRPAVVAEVEAISVKILNEDAIELSKSTMNLSL